MFISVEAVRWVFTQSRSERSARLVLLAIATHCNDDGCCWPGIGAICTYTKLSKNSVLKAIEELVELKEITVERGGRGAGDTNHYYLFSFMQSRVQKGAEFESKGAEEAGKGFTRVDTNKNLELERVEEAASPQPSIFERVRQAEERSRLNQEIEKAWYAALYEKAVRENQEGK